MRTNFLISAGLLLAALPLSAGEIDAKAAFARLRTMAGEWQADTSMGKARLTYELIGGGTALVERESFEKMPEMSMETVYHLDGERLLLTHYCMVGNQPRMIARGYRPETGELRFEFLDATNLASPAAGHMHNASMRLVDDKHFTSDWEFFENGRLKNKESFQYTRVR